MRALRGDPSPVFWAGIRAGRLLLGLALRTVRGQIAVSTPRDPDQMKLKVRNSKAKKAKKTGFLTRQKTAGGRKVNKRHRSRHGSF